MRVLFDEAHSESWSISRARAREISPGYPEYSSYETAAALLSAREFAPERNTDLPLLRDRLQQVDLLALLHPCDPRWERTVSDRSPKLSPDEVLAIQSWVAEGGGLLVVTEYEHDKYGDNLNELLAPFGLSIENTTVLDREGCRSGNPAWVPGHRAPSPLGHRLTIGAESVCFYQAGTCTTQSPDARYVLLTGPRATPPSAGLVAAAPYGKGRVVVVTDSLLFGDDHITSPDHQQLWLNLCYWLAAPAFDRFQSPWSPGPTALSDPWLELKGAVNELRLLQQGDGSVDPQHQPAAHALSARIGASLQALGPRFHHQQPYLQAVLADLDRWTGGGFLKPDFAASLAAYNPQDHRVDGSENLVFFPLYTPNASLETRFEALLLRVPWPGWLADLERTRYPNPKFAPAHLVDFTAGYASECAVLFPETVSVSGKPTHQFATIFCDREARRLQATARRAIECVDLAAPPEVECLLASLSVLQDALALWDLVHDQAHSLGELPFDPFMIRQRSPFWVYALEELRVDLRAFGEAMKLKASGCPLAQYVPYAILLDRVFRFPLSGTRVKNYDGLAGQLLFAFLHEREVVCWCDNILSIRWAELPGAVEELRREIAALYRHGANCSRLAFWIEAHDLVARYVKPNIASRWSRGNRAIDSEADPAKWIALVQEDEFPLGSFHLNLKRRMGDVRWAGRIDERVRHR
ncbi:MAG TPA: hypothetical protein DCM86_08395 [Verrucomicrobiales bacterium]|nr:hypothetical protein [Verrucomicrobiales bacterium]